MKKNYTLILMVFFCSLFLNDVIAQTAITGNVKDQETTEPVYVNIIQKGTTNGTTSDLDGNFTLQVKAFPATLVFSSVGYESKTIEVTSSEFLSILMSENTALEEIVLVGNRAKPRTILDSPVPIDNIGVSELKNSGKPTIDRMLTFKVPSFNSQNQAISDATAHYDPADLRGLGPSRTLVLVNGKRKNQSAQVYLNRTPGKGEVGIDLKSIPTAAIERVEVLRDGASAQYGSDAIAGVINMVLKKNASYSNFSMKSGMTSEGDGFTFSTDFNSNVNIGDKGYLNLTFAYYHQDITNRAGEPGVSDLPDTPRPNEIAWAEANPDLGMHVGQPEMDKGDLFMNFGYPLSDKIELYTFNGFTHRAGKSYAYYRAPYWRRDVADSGFLGAASDFEGYQPTFETIINDNINTLGLDVTLGNEFKMDASLTYGRNRVNYTVKNSLNRDYLADFGTSPRTFEPGGYSLQNLIGNLDFSKVFTEQISMSFGAEFKKEFFQGYQGDAISYYKGGSDSFAGIKPEEAVYRDRENVGVYTSLDFDITSNLLLGAAVRYEDFSDFGDNISWKLNGRYKLGDKGALRASVSTGFRAPTLHQRYLTNTQYIIISGSSEPLLQGTLGNDDSAIQALGVNSLDAETSLNYSAGITYKINPKFSASVDFYHIEVEDRVLLSSQQGYRQDPGDIDLNGDGSVSGSELLTDVNDVEQILIDRGVAAIQFFLNAGTTKTTGLDVVLNYNRIELGQGKLNASLAANFNETKIDAISSPDVLASSGYNVFDRQEQGLITNSRPNFKIISGFNYEIKKWNLGLNNTLFGPVTVTAPSGGYSNLDAFLNGSIPSNQLEEVANGIDQELDSKIVTDFNVGYKVTEDLTINGIFNNIFDVYPEPTDPATNTAQAGSRFVYSSEVQQLGQLGMNFTLGLNYRF